MKADLPYMPPGKNTKVALLIPCHGGARIEFVQSLAQMVARSIGSDESLSMLTLTSNRSALSIGRNELFKLAIDYHADYALMMDADHSFPSDALLRLLRRNLPAVGVNYPRRAFPTGPTAYRNGADGKRVPVYTSPEQAAANPVEAVDSLGLGLCLINLRVVMAALRSLAATTDEPIFPLFHFAYSREAGISGEDYFFFDKLRRAGIVPHIDHELSLQIGHVVELVMTNAHAVDQRALWEATSDSA